MPFSLLSLSPLPVGMIFLTPIAFKAECLPACPPRLIHCCHSRETIRTTFGKFF
jgi:hypothetical protein